MIGLPTPRKLIQRAELYEQWATLLAAGVPMFKALGTLRRSALPRRYHRLIDRVTDRLEEGESVSNALAPEQRAIPRFDQALLSTGERSGRLDVCLKELAGHYRTRAKWLNQAWQALSYPLLVLAVGLVVFPVDLIVTIFTDGDWMPFLLHKARILGTVCLGLVSVTVLLSIGPQATWIQALLERIGGIVPVLGSALHERALARLILSLDALLNTGMGVVEAWPAAANASGSTRLQNEVRRWAPSLEDGHPASDALANSRLFPDLFTDAYRVGETSGKMQDTLVRLRQHYDESAAHKMEQLATWAPRLIYFAIALYIGWSVIRFWQGYFAQFDSLLGM